MLNKNKWDLRYLEMAKLVSTWSKDPSTKCGAVIVDPNNHIVSVGFNGFPVYVDDKPERLHDRELKYAMTIHAERNVMIFANRNLYGCTMYTYPMQACSECAAMMIQSGITRHVSFNKRPERWNKSFQIASDMFKEAFVEIKLYEENQ